MRAVLWRPSNDDQPDSLISGACAKTLNPQQRGASEYGYQKGKARTNRYRTDKRYVQRNPDGNFKETVDVSRSLAADRRSKSKTVAKPGYGDQGDQPKRATKKATKKSAKKK